MDNLEVTENPVEGIKTETQDEQAQLSVYPLSTGNSHLAQTSVGNQGIADPDRTETSSHRENSVEVVQTQSQADNRTHPSVEQAETSSSDSWKPVLVGSQVAAHHLEDLLTEAKTAYGSERPPFVVKSYHNHEPGNKRTVVLAAEDGDYPRSSIKTAQLTYCSWDNSCVYATIDLDGRTVIVQPKKGGFSRYGRGGATYRQWLGTEQGLSKLPIAYPQQSSSALLAVKGKGKRRTSSAESESPPTEPSRKRILRASKPIRTSTSGILFNWTGDGDDANEPSLRQNVPQEATSIGATSSEPSSSSDSDDDQDTKLFPRQKLPDTGSFSGSFSRPSALPTPGASIPRSFPVYNNDTADQLNANEDDSSHHNMKKDEINALLLHLRNEGKTFKQIRNYIDAKTGKSTAPSTWWSRYRRIELKQAKARRAGEAARSKQAKVSQRRRSEPNPHVQEISETASDKDNSTTRRSTRNAGRRAKSTVNPAYGSTSPYYLGSSKESSQKPFGANLTGQHDTRSALQTTQYAALGTSGGGPRLAPQKLNHTTIRILHTGSFTPLKLRSCDTMQALFHTVRDLCTLDFAQERVNALKVTFPWMPKNDDSRSMLLREQYEDSFEVFLETVDEAPCWQSEAGKCTIDIEII